jgi:hypothetical protein
MDIVAALFIDAIDVQQPTPGGPTKIDLTGVHFSAVAPSQSPFTLAPHLVVLVRCAADEPGTGALEVTYWRGDEQVARNVQPLQVEPGKFSYRLVRGEVDFDDIGSIEARCRVDGGHITVVPYTVLPPA